MESRYFIFLLAILFSNLLDAQTKLTQDTTITREDDKFGVLEAKVTNRTLTSACLEWETVPNAIGYELQARHKGAVTDWGSKTIKTQRTKVYFYAPAEKDYEYRVITYYENEEPIFSDLFELPAFVSPNLFAQNRCLHFDGVDDYVYFPNTTLQGDATISFWFKPDAKANGGDDDRIFSVGPGPRLEVGIADSDCQDGSVWIYDEASTTQLCFDANLRDGAWHHLATVLDGANRSLYLDGVLTGAWVSGGDPLYLDNIRFGRWTGGGVSTSYSGMLDEVRIWDYPRTIEEMDADRNCELDGDETGLVDYYNFNQGIVEGNNELLEELLDATSTQNNGKLRNFELTGSTSNFINTGAPIMGCTLPK